MLNTKDWKTVFTDDFYTADLMRRNFRTELPWGRNEINRESESQYFADIYAPDHGFMRSGGTDNKQSRLAARKTKPENLLGAMLQPFTSACISSHGSIELEYGVFEVFARLPIVFGFRSRISLIQVNGSRNRPNPQEIVIADKVGDNVSQSIHAYAHELSAVRRMLVNPEPIKPSINGYKKFQCIVEPGWITLAINGRPTWSIPMPASMYGARWCLAVQLQTGNELSWGRPLEDTVWPVSLGMQSISVYSTPTTRGEAEPAKKRGIEGMRRELDGAPPSPGTQGLQTAIEVNRVLASKRRAIEREQAKKGHDQAKESVEAVARNLPADRAKELREELDAVLKVSDSTPSASSESVTTTLADRLTQRASSLLKSAASLTDSPNGKNSNGS